MGVQSNIQWTDATWNVAVGCRKVDADCKFCYMYRDSMRGTRYNPREIRRTKTVFDLPLKLKEPSRIFTSSLTDFFIEEVDEYRNECWDIIRQCPQHTFQILTKRPERIVDHLPQDWGDGWNNVWLGVSAGSESAKARVGNFCSTTYHTGRFKNNIKFLSIEPLYQDFHLIWYGPPGHKFWYSEIDWVIIGGESGNDTGPYHYRPCKIEWIEKIISDCREIGVPVFVKQLGTHLAKQMKLKDRHGGDIDEWPEHLRIREFPKPNNL